MHHDSKLLASSCTICAKIETPRSQDLLCKDCVHNAIEVIRNSVIGNEELNNVMRHEINSIFEYCDHYRRSTREDLRQGHILAPAGTSPVSVKKLGIQLQKLEVMNSKMKLNGMSKAQGVTSLKVQNVTANIEEMQQKINELKRKLEEKRSQLQSLYQKKAQSVESEIQLLYNHSIDQTKRYTLLVQHQHYQVLREVAFPNLDAWKSSSRRGPKKRREKLLLFDLPVIDLLSFLAHNNKLTEINSFLENLIRLQIQLSRLFFRNDEAFKLPFIDYLAQLLPDSHFYDLVQEKINFVTNDGRPLTPEEGRSNSSEPLPKPTKLTVSPDDTIDKIMIEGNVIRIPISFKTINFQRRTSALSPDITSSAADLMELKRDLMSPDSISTTNKLPLLSLELSPLKSTLKGKRIVITAHKILTKPFSRLKSKEYLKFVLVVVKILINFQVFFHLTTTKIKGVEVKRRALQGTLASTINQLRSHGNAPAIAGTDGRPETVDYDFELILSKLANMDFYFYAQKSLVGADRETQDPKSSASSILLYSTVSQMNNSNLAPTEVFPSEYSGSLIHISESQMSSHKKPSKLRVLYNNVFNRQSGPFPPNSAVENVYGNVSETNSNSDESKLKVSGIESTNSITLTNGKHSTEVTGEPGRPNYNIKSVMGDVHKILAYKNGNGRAATLGSRAIGPDKDMQLATRSMLAESKAQLDEWDMVSQMYK